MIPIEVSGKADSCERKARVFCGEIHDVTKGRDFG